MLRSPIEGQAPFTSFVAALWDMVPVVAIYSDRPVPLSDLTRSITRPRDSAEMSMNRTPMPGENVYWSALGQTQATAPFASSHSEGQSGNANSIISLVPTGGGAVLSIKSPPPPIPPARLSNNLPSGVLYLTLTERDIFGS